MDENLFLGLVGTSATILLGGLALAGVVSRRIGFCLGPREILRRAPERPEQFLGRLIHWRVRLFRKEDLAQDKVRLTCFLVGEPTFGNAIFANVASSPEVDLLSRDAVFMLNGRIAELAPGGAEISRATVDKIESHGRRK